MTKLVMATILSVVGGLCLNACTIMGIAFMLSGAFLVVLATKKLQGPADEKSYWPREV